MLPVDAWRHLARDRGTSLHRIGWAVVRTVYRKHGFQVCGRASRDGRSVNMFRTSRPMIILAEWAGEDFNKCVCFWMSTSGDFFFFPIYQPHLHHSLANLASRQTTTPPLADVTQFTSTYNCPAWHLISVPMAVMLIPMLWRYTLYLTLNVACLLSQHVSTFNRYICTLNLVRTS